MAIKHAAMEGIVPPGGESIPKVYTSGAAVIKVDHCKVENWEWKQLSNFYSGKDTMFYWWGRNRLIDP